MCGIAGILGELNPVKARGALEKMAEAIRHRGPDAHGFWDDQAAGVYLAHRRLSIIDLSPTGAQPMHSSSGRSTIVFNGEIYNFVELREELQQQGRIFRGSSDTEVLLELYEQRGESFVELLRGMFALAVWDGPRRQLLLARDPLGKKPLYLREAGGVLAFASEISALHAHPLANVADLSDAALDGYLAFGCTLREQTIFKGITELLPGRMLIRSLAGATRERRYWQPEYQPQLSASRAELLERIEFELRESVRIRLRADVPIGVFLSGGLDSGLITALAAEISGQRLKTFCVGFADAAVDERPLAELVARRYGTDHSSILIEPDLQTDLPRILQSYGEPFADPSALPSHWVSEVASRQVKVVLNGDGGDELFCGYRRHLAALQIDRLEGFCPSGLPAKFAGAISAALPVPQARRSRYEFIHRMLRIVAGAECDRLLRLSTDGFSFAERMKLYREPLREDFFTAALGATDFFGQNLSLTDELLRFDLELALPDDLLVKMDIAAMSHGLEGRSPFLDRDLTGLAMKIPSSEKLAGGKTKSLLRDLAGRYLPAEVVTAPKRGFEIPLARWINHDLSQLCRDTLLSSSGILHERFKRSELEQLLRGPAANRLSTGRWAGLVWILLVLGCWDLVHRRAKQLPQH